jgi:hypothetical protein
MKTQSTIKSKLHVFFTFSLHGDVFNNHREYFLLVGGGAPICLSHISHCYIWSSNCCDHGYCNTAQVPMSSSTAMPPSISASTPHSEAPLRPMYLSVNAFHFHIFTHKLLRPALFKPGIPFLCATPSYALGHRVTPLPMLSALVSTQFLQHSPKAVQNIRTSWLSLHMNMSKTVSSYIAITKITIISSVQLLTDQSTENQFILSSHSGAVSHSSLVIFVFSKQSCSTQCSAFSTHTSLSNKHPWSSKGPLTHSTYSPWYGTQSNVPKHSANSP